MPRAAASTIERSGSRWRESGVGSAIRIASASFRSAYSVVAWIRPCSTSGASRALSTSSMWLSPRFSASTTAAHDVDEEDAAARLREGGREGQADIAGPDDCDVIRHGGGTLAA